MSRRLDETRTHLPTDADSATTWTSAHVFRHDDLDALLTQGVAPLAMRLTEQGLIRGFFYLRYWDGGPHIRVRLRSAPAHETDVRQAVTDKLGVYLRTNPSRDLLEDTTYRSSAARLASEEDRTDYERTMRPPDTISFEDYPPEHASFGHGISLQAVEQHFCDSTAIALRTLALAPQQRISAAMVMTLATEITLLPPNAGVNTSRSDNADSWGEELVAMCARLRAAVPPPNSGVPALDWLRAVGDLRARLDTLRGANLFDAPHARPVAYAVHRCLHLHLNRIGIASDQEVRMRRLARQAALGAL